MYKMHAFWFWWCEVGHCLISFKVVLRRPTFAIGEIILSQMQKWKYWTVLVGVVMFVPFSQESNYMFTFWTWEQRNIHFSTSRRSHASDPLCIFACIASWKSGITLLRRVWYSVYPLIRCFRDSGMASSNTSWWWNTVIPLRCSYGSRRF